jgi:hypothetical protein
VRIRVFAENALDFPLARQDLICIITDPESHSDTLEFPQKAGSATSTQMDMVK